MEIGRNAGKRAYSRMGTVLNDINIDEQINIFFKSENAR